MCDNQRTCKKCGVNVGKGKQLCADCAKPRRIGWMPESLNCRMCDRPFTQKAKGQRFCCKKCTDKHHAKSWKPVKCSLCEVTFVPKSASGGIGFCSRKCARVSRAGRKREVRLARKRAYGLFASLMQCRFCGWHYVSRKGLLHCGSADCVKADDRHKKGLAIIKSCRACGVVINENAKGYRPSLCSECSKQAKLLIRRRSKRKQRLNGKKRRELPRHVSANVLKGLNAFRVAAGRQCQLCGLLMSKACNPNSDRALEIDHALPVCLGGRDEYPNLRPICRRCNGLKGATIAPDIALESWTLKTNSYDECAV